MFKKIAIAAAVFGIWQSAWGGNTTPAPILVSAQVNKNCAVSAAPTNPAGITYDPVSGNVATDATFSATVTFNCTKNSTGVTVAVDNGGHFNAGLRRLSDGQATPTFLNYNLYQPTAVGAGATCTTTDFSSGAYAVAQANFTSSTAAVVVKVCGNIPQGQEAIPGTYTDTVNLQVNF